jgi:copper chaperone CopZ
MSKTIKQIFTLGLIFILGSFTTGKETKTIEIKTSAVCEMCKERIERELVFEKGVKQVNVNLQANLITVTYRTDKTSPEKLRAAIAKMGYWADEVPADENGFKKLPQCCQKEGCGKK